MSFGAELKDFAAGFKAGYDVTSDRRDKKWERERQALNDPIDRDYKQASTESMRKHTAWYDKIADVQTRTGEKSLEWADRDHQRAIDATDAQIFGNFFGGGRRRTGKPGEVLTGDAPDGTPDASGSPVGDHASGATEETTDSTPDAADDSSGDDTGDADVSADPASYRPANNSTEIYNRFMQTVYHQGVKNPNGLAAIAATATRESKFAPANAYGRWNDPSESGGAGTSGGIMSWRGPRYAGLQQFAAKRGDDPRRPSPETQAMYLFHEDPSLKDKLNSARSAREAQQVMNNAWAFAGYDRNSPERNARLSLADKYANQYGQFLSHGGLVVHAAVGGTIPDDPNADQEQNPPVQMAQAAPMQALPVDNAPVPTERPVDQTAPEGDTSGGNQDVGYDPAVAGDPRVVGFTKAHEAVLDGIRYSLQEMGLAKGAAVTDPDRAAKMADYLKGTGAAPKAIIDQAYDAVDPKKELPESERTMAALGMVYDHYIKRGEPAKAKAAAASIVQYQRKLFQQYSAITKAAVADGDIDAAAKSAVKAYDSVPDGQGMKVKKLENGRYQIEVTDEATGKTISKPVLTPQEIGGWAMKVNPGSFDQFIMEAAGQRKQGGGAPSEDFQKLAAGLDEGKMPSNADMAKLPLAEQKELRMRSAAAAKAQGGGEDKPLSFGDAQTAKTAIGTAWEEMAAATDADGVAIHKGMAELPPADATTIKSSAANIFGTPKNRTPDYDVTEQDAIVAAGLVAQAAPDQYKVTDDKGGKIVELPDGTPVWMTKPDFTKLSNVYKRHARESAKKKQDEVNAGEDAAAKSKASNERAGKYEKDNPAFMAPPGTEGTPQSAVPTGRFDLPLGASQEALDNIQKLFDTGQAESNRRLEQHKQNRKALAIPN